jgi:hypothetical protein
MRNLRGAIYSRGVIQVAIVNAKEETIIPFGTKRCSSQCSSILEAVPSPSSLAKTLPCTLGVGSGDEKHGKGKNENHMKEKKVKRKEAREEEERVIYLEIGVFFFLCCR